MTRRELLPYFFGIPLFGWLFGHVKANATCPPDSDLDYVDANECCREFVAPFFNGKPVKGIQRGSASEGWVEAWPENIDKVHSAKRFRGQVRFRVGSVAEVQAWMKDAVCLW